MIESKVLAFDNGSIRVGEIEAIQNGLIFVRHEGESTALSYYPECIVQMN